MWKTETSFKYKSYTVNKDNNWTINTGADGFKKPVFLPNWKKMLYDGDVVGTFINTRKPNASIERYSFDPYVVTTRSIVGLFQIPKGTTDFDKNDFGLQYLRRVSKISILGTLYPQDAMAQYEHRVELQVIINRSGTYYLLHQQSNINWNNENQLFYWVFEYVVPPQYRNEELVIRCVLTSPNSIFTHTLIRLAVDQDRVWGQNTQTGEKEWFKINALASDSELEVLVVEGDK